MILRNMLRIAALIIAAGTAQMATAATYQFTGGWSGGKLGTVEFDITITADFTTPIMNGTAGLTISKLTSSVLGGDFVPDGGLGYTNYPTYDWFYIGGLVTGVTGVLSNTTDFTLSIYNYANGPTIRDYNVADSLSGKPGLGDPSQTSLQVTLVPPPPAPVPLPASGLLLIAGLGGMAGAGYRKRRKS